MLANGVATYQFVEDVPVRIRWVEVGAQAYKRTVSDFYDIVLADIQVTFVDLDLLECRCVDLMLSSPTEKAVFEPLLSRSILFT